MMFWAGNAVIGRAVSGLVPPFTLSFWRWALALILLLPFGAKHVIASWPVVRRHWRILVTLGILSVAAYNTFLYMALQHTSAINASVVGSVLPVVIVAASWLAFREPIDPRQLLGISLSMIGVGLVVGQGRLDVLLALDFNRGDLLVLVAVASWALFSLALRWRPAGLHPIGLLTVQVAVGLVALLPLYLWDLAAGRTAVVSAGSLAAIAYVGIFPSVVAYIFWNRAVAEAGASVAGLFTNLVPVFASILAVIFLGESLHWYHGAAIALLFAGIGLATSRTSRAAAPKDARTVSQRTSDRRGP